MALNPGDIAITGIKSDNPDEFTFVALVDIAAGEEIFFTDNGVFADGTFRANEGVVKYTAPAGGLTAGTTVLFTGSPVSGDFTTEDAGFALSTAGDQVIAYQGTINAPTFLYAAQTNSNQFQIASNDAQQSDLPLGLVIGETAVAVGAGSGAESEFDNAFYIGPTTGTKEALLASIADPANWTGENSGTILPAQSFTVETLIHVKIASALDSSNGGGATNLTSFTATPDNSANNGQFSGSRFDVFGITDRTVNSDFADDSAGSSPSDRFGLVGTGDNNPFFGVEDLDNSNNPGGTGSASWVFDITGATVSDITIDFAAMGNFEAGDNRHTVTASVDGGPEVTLFAINADNSALFAYTVESGFVVAIDDPLKIDGTVIPNTFTTFTSSAAAGLAGDELTITLTSGVNNGGTEAFALRDIMVFSTDSGGDTGGPGAGLDAPYAFDFETDPFAEGWQVVSVDADNGNSWALDSFSGDQFMEVNAFGDSAAANDWLISPAFNLDATEGETVSFFNAKNFDDAGVDDPEVDFLVSTDYDGTSDPTTATWTSLPYAASTGGFTEVFSGNIDISAITGESVYFAFQYTSSGTDAGSSALWQVDDFAISLPSGVQDVFIHDIQGETNFASGTSLGGGTDASPLLGETVRVQGVVTQVLNSTGEFGGFFLQEEDADADANPFTSEGIFVVSSAPVEEGDVLAVTGLVGEFEGQTQLTATDVIVESTGNSDLVTATEITFPVANVVVDHGGDLVADLEAFEGMLVTVPETLTVTENFDLGRFGTLQLSSEGRLVQFTEENAPSVAGFDLALQDNAARTLFVDDGSDGQNPTPILVPDLGADGILDQGETIRVGDTYSDLTGVLSYSIDDQSSFSNHEWRLHRPDGDLTQSNPRPVEPDDVGGSLTVASFNVLNFFTTLDTFPGDEGVGPSLQNARGADTNPQDPLGTPGPTDEFDRQLEKLVAALDGADADIVGLIELENDFLAGGNFPTDQNDQLPRDIAIQELVDAVNAVSDRTYDWVDPGQETVGTDAISQAFIYDTATVSLNGALAIFDTPAFTDPLSVGVDRNRPAIAQTFTEIASGESVVVTANHFISKGASARTAADEDALDGQGRGNGTRTAAAEALVEWLETDPTGTGEEDFLVIGDFNAYTQEDPVQAIIAGADGVVGTDDDYDRLETETSYVFGGESGNLDHAFASASLTDQVTGATAWRINAEEPSVLDYNLEFFRDPSLLSADAYRASDHDPLIIGLALSSEPEKVLVAGTDARDVLVGTAADEVFDLAGGSDVVSTGEGADCIDFSGTFENGVREFVLVTDYDTESDSITGFDRADVTGDFTFAGRTILFLSDGDVVQFLDVPSVDALTFEDPALS